MNVCIEGAIAGHLGGLLLLVFTFWGCAYFPEFAKDARTRLVMVLILLLHHLVALGNGAGMGIKGAEYDAMRFHNYAVYLINHGEWDVPYYENRIYCGILAIAYKIFGVSLFLGSEISVVVLFLSALVFLRFLDLLNIGAGKPWLLLLFAGSPAMIVWTSVTLREPFQLLFFMSAMYFSSRWHREQALKWVFLAILSALFMGLFHHGLMVFSVMVCGFTFLGNLSMAGFRKRNILFFVILLLGISYLWRNSWLGSGCPNSLFAGEWVKQINVYRLKLMDLGSDSFATYGLFLDNSSWPNMFEALAKMVLCFVLSPFPWQISNPLSFYAGCESLLRLALIIAAIIHAWRRREVWGFLFLYFGVTCMWAVGTANYGTAMRHHLVHQWIVVLLGGPILREWFRLLFRKKSTFILILLSFGSVFALLSVEVIFRFFPVCDVPRVQDVSEENPMLKFEANRTFTWSRGKFFSIQNSVRINNWGFVSEVDYDPHGEKPLLAIIGDSYVEALMVPWKESLSGRLHQKLQPMARAYSFASSGSSLSQYLAYAEYATDVFKPQAFVITVVGNDFDESLLKYKSAPGFHYFKKKFSGGLEVTRVDFKRSFFRKLVPLSAFARYLLLNLEFPVLYEIFFQAISQPKVPEISTEVSSRLFVGNTSFDPSRERILDSQEAVIFFLGEITKRTNLTSRKILFVIDGFRLYSENPDVLSIAQQSFWGKMREYFIEEATKRDFPVIDLEASFSSHFRENAKRFEFPEDGHWNTLGHQVCFEEVKNSVFWSEMFSE